MRQLKCLSLAFSRAADDGARDDPSDGGVRHTFESILPYVSTAPLQDSKSQQINQGSITSMVRCIVSDWGTNAQTNFYIPPEQLAGYSYLFEDNKKSGRSSFNVKVQRNTRHHVHITNFHGHHHPSFVHAEEVNNLHPHHYELYSKASSNSSFDLTRMYELRFLHKGPALPRISNQLEPDQIMTVPYIHPNLNLPVPPLHLPWYFGLFCWSFAFAGVLMLRLPQKWTIRAGRCVSDNNMPPQRHWFPYRTFAWALILCQVSPSLV
jgi:hypothetical protein